MLTQFQYFVNTLTTYYTLKSFEHDEKDYLKYDVFDKKTKYIQNRYYYWIQLPENEKDMINNFRTPYFKFYPHNIFVKTSYPPIDRVMTLFKNEKRHRLIHPNGMNALFAAFAGYWVHTFLKTWYENKDGKLFPYQNNNNMINGGPIYGETVEQEAVFRKNQKGGGIRMRKGKLPLRICDVTEEEANLFHLSNPFRKKDLFLCGFARCNVAVGNFVLHTLCQRNHNRICRMMQKIDKRFTENDEDAFQMAKTINIYMVIKIVIHDYISSIGGYNNYPNIITEYMSPNTIDFKAIYIPFEYNLIYQFHNLLPEKIDGQSLPDMAFNAELFYSKTISEWIDILEETPCHTQHFRNCQSYFLPVEQKAIEIARSVNVLSYCEMRRKFNLTIPMTFLDITGDEWSAKKLKSVYNNVENVDFYVGINSESVVGNGFLGETVQTLLASVALNDLTVVMHSLREYIIRMNVKMLPLVDDFKFLNEFINTNLEGSSNRQVAPTNTYSFRTPNNQLPKNPPLTLPQALLAIINEP